MHERIASAPTEKHPQSEQGRWIMAARVAVSHREAEKGKGTRHVPHRPYDLLDTDDVVEPGEREKLRELLE
jgi:hypothetical protein